MLSDATLCSAFGVLQQVSGAEHWTAGWGCDCLVYRLFDWVSKHDADYFTMMQIIIEGRLEVKLPTIWTDEKQRWEESERREE